MIKINITVLSNNLKRLCNERGLTGYKLSKISGVGESSISLIMSGKRKSVTLTTVHKLAKALRVHPDQLLKSCIDEEYIVEDIVDTLDIIFEGDDLKMNGFILSSLEKQYLKLKFFEHIDNLILLRKLFESNNIKFENIKDINEIHKLRNKILRE